MKTPPFFEFILKSPTPWHAAEEIARRLKLKGFHPLQEKEAWKLEHGKSYFVEREGSLIAAFSLPKKIPKSALIVASHTDSPALKVKPEPDIVNRDIVQIGTEVYGGPLLHSWLDRDLAIAGRIETDKGPHLVYLKDHPVVIPQLAIHLDRTISEKGILVHKQDHLKAILAIQGKQTLQKLLKKHVGFETLYAFDLFLVPTETPSLLGISKDLMAGYRIDNLSSAYASLEAILHAKTREETVQLAIFWDHEEIGSMSSIGADSLFVSELLERISIGLGQTREHFHRLKSSSLIISADVGHGWNPNFGDKYDPQNSALLGNGVMIKFNASKKYATDAASAAAIMKIAKKHKLQIQQTANRSDIPSGSTVGPIMSANTGIPTIDLGVPLWAMHSTREIMASSDLNDLITLLKAACDDWNPL